MKEKDRQGGIGDFHVKWKFRGITGYTRVEPWGHSLCSATESET